MVLVFGALEEKKSSRRHVTFKRISSQIIVKMNTLGFSENLLFNTVHVIATDEEGYTITGTSFLFEYESEGQSVPCLVTNKHVVKGTLSGTLSFHLKKGD